MIVYKKLDEFLDFEQPTQFLVKSTDYDDSYKTPVLTAGQSLLLGYTNETDGIYEANKDNPTIIFDDFTTSFHWIDFNFKVKSSAMKMLRPKKDVNFRYIYYAMLQIRFVPQQHQRHWISKYSKFTIPLPPPSEQNRIVGILDTFTASINNLKEQIVQRRKQFEYYRNKLLSFEEGEFENKRLGDIASFKYGYTGVAEDEGEARYVRITDITPDGNLQSIDAKYIETINEDNKMYLLKKGDILVARIGATYGKTLYYNEDYPSLYASFLIKIQFKNDFIDSRYYWQFSKSHYYWSQANKLVGGGAQPQFNANALCDVIVPIPSLDKQRTIVRTLDTFEASIQNLEAQLDLRQKQYEYYRNKLLTFE